MRGCKESFSCKPPWFGVPELWLTTQGPASRHEAMSNNADLGGRRMMRRQWGIINELAKRGARFWCLCVVPRSLCDHRLDAWSSRSHPINAAARRHEHFLVI